MLNLTILSIPQLIQLSVMNEFIVGALLVLIVIFFIKLVLEAVDKAKLHYTSLIMGIMLAIAVVFVPTDKTIDWHLKDKGYNVQCTKTITVYRRGLY